MIEVYFNIKTIINNEDFTDEISKGKNVTVKSKQTLAIV